MEMAISKFGIKAQRTNIFTSGYSLKEKNNNFLLCCKAKLVMIVTLVYYILLLVNEIKEETMSLILQ